MISARMKKDDGELDVNIGNKMVLRLCAVGRTAHSLQLYAAARNLLGNKAHRDGETIQTRGKSRARKQKQKESHKILSNSPLVSANHQHRNEIPPSKTDISLKKRSETTKTTGHPGVKTYGSTSFVTDAEVMNEKHRDSNSGHTADDHTDDSPQYSALEMLNSHEKRAQRTPETRKRNFATTTRHLRGANCKRDATIMNEEYQYSKLSQTADDHTDDSPEYSALEMISSREKEAQRAPKAGKRNFATATRHLRSVNEAAIFNEDDADALQDDEQESMNWDGEMFQDMSERQEDDIISIMRQVKDADDVNIPPAMAVPVVGQRLEYLREIKRKKDRAARSILLYAEASTDYDHIHNFCTQFGAVESIDTAHIHTVSNEQKAMLVEFKEVSSARKVMYDKKRDEHASRSSYLPGTHFVWRDKIFKDIRCSTSKRSAIRRNRLSSQNTIGSCVMALQEMVSPPALSDQLNYLQCQIIDDAMYQHMPNVQTIPHGSTLSTLTTSSGDLDMCLHPDGLRGYSGQADDQAIQSEASNFLYNVAIYDSISASSDRRMIWRISKSLSAVSRETKVELTLPQARVPIIRLISTVTLGQCDICISNSINDSVMASLMLRLLCDHDQRFLYLNRCVRFWASQHQLTNEKPGGYLINFSLTHMLVYFLQQMYILPTVNHIVSTAYTKPEQTRVTLTDQQLNELGALYREFFRFWALFDFEQRIDISTGQAHKHSNYFPNAPLQIINTVIPNRNIAMRMRKEYLNLFVVKCAETSLHLSSATNETAIGKVFCKVHKV